jgi:endonuclease III-like uncharacterized protein
MQYGDKLQKLICDVENLIKNQKEVKKTSLYLHSLRTCGIGKKGVDNILCLLCDHGFITNQKDMVVLNESVF